MATSTSGFSPISLLSEFLQALDFARGPAIVELDVAPLNPP